MRRLALTATLALLALPAACAPALGPAATDAPTQPAVKGEPAVAKDMSQGTGQHDPKAMSLQPAPTLEQALAAVGAAVERASLASHGDPPLAERARAAKLDQAALLRLLGDAAAACPTEAKCRALADDRALGRLLDTLAVVGTLGYEEAGAGDPGSVPGAVEILGGGLIAPEVILGAVKDKTRHEEECHQGHQENQ